MEAQEYWIDKGQIVERSMSASGAAASGKSLLFQKEFVKIECNANGTVIKWVMFGANWTSLYFCKELLSAHIAPFTLSFFNSGWFSEVFDNLVDAGIRIDQLIAKSDVRFSAHTFTRPFNPVEYKLSATLKEAWTNGGVDESTAVHCTIDMDRELTRFEHIGANSALAKIWGISPVSFPSRSGHSYDRVVSKSYYEVVKTGRPLYDHVLAAMVNPSGEVKWYGYHRLIFPCRKPRGTLAHVSVACEVAEIDIPLL
jgi:hypothetical protein